MMVIRRGKIMKILVITKDKTTMAFNRNNAVECALRTLGKIIGKKPYIDEDIMVMKVPEKMGDMTLVAKYYQNYPTICANNKDIYDENEAAEYYLKTLKGNKINIGYGLVTNLCEEIYVQYTIFDEKDIQ